MNTNLSIFNLFDEPCHLIRSTYQCNGRLALYVRFENDPEGFEDIVISKNLDGEPCAPDCCYIDTNNCPWAEKFLLDNAIGQPVGIGFSGFCIYPCYKIDANKISEVK